MLKEFLKGSSGRVTLEQSRSGQLDFEELKRLPGNVRNWLMQRLARDNDARDRNNLALMVERSHRAHLERQLVTTQVALAKACTELIETKQQAQHFRFQSLHDSLTTLSNSTAIHQCLEAFLKEYGAAEGKLAVLFIDIDNFKAVNDLHGHWVGDEVLQIVSARINHAIRAEDRIGRLGGDEFLCLIANAGSRDNTAKIAVQIFDAVREPIQIGSLQMVVFASIGIAFSPGNAVNAEGLIKQADSAMYRAKRLKTAYEFFDPRSDVDRGLKAN
jgi:diguanylate cyclase